MLQIGTKFKGKWFEGTVEVLSINEEQNSLEVQITRNSGHYHNEDWNYQHTLVGFQQGDYFFEEALIVNNAFIKKGVTLKSRFSLAQIAKKSLSFIDVSIPDDVYEIIKEWQRHRQVPIDLLAEYIPFLRQAFPCNEFGLMGTYFTYEEKKHLSTDKNFNENCIVIGIEAEGYSSELSAAFVYDFVKKEFFIWSYIGSSGIYGRNRHDLEIIKAEIAEKVTDKIVWKTK